MRIVKVALHAAMKSGLKVNRRAVVVLDNLGCTPCRDEKRTERWKDHGGAAQGVSCCTPCRDEKRTESRFVL